MRQAVDAAASTRSSARPLTGRGRAWAAVLGLAAGLMLLPADVGALSIARPAGAFPETASRARGRVAAAESRHDADGVLRTHVVLVDAAGAETARFAVPGGVDGGSRWVIDGVPAFVVGEVVDVGLAATSAGFTVADGEDAVRRLAPASDGRSGAAFLAEVAIDPALAPIVSGVDPELSGAVPDSPTIVTVRGSRFGPGQGDGRVTFQGLFERVDAQVVSWADDVILCHVPAPGLLGAPQILSGAVKVWTPAGGWSDGDPFIGGPRFRILYQWAGDAWPLGRLPVAVYVNPDGFEWGAAAGPVVAGALEKWNVPGSYARLVYSGLTAAEAGPHHASGERSGDGRNTVRWRTPWPHNPGWLAVTWSRIDTLTFAREETDLEINGDTYRWTLDPESDREAYDLPSTLAHEFGHWMRLGHTQSIASVMLPFFGPGERRRDLSASDRFGASWIYPAYGAVAAPLEIASGAPLDLALRACDREGRPREGLAGTSIVTRLVSLAEGVPAPGPLDAALDAPAVAIVPAGAKTDPNGDTTARVDGLADGLYRIEVSVAGALVRPAPLLRVGAPAVAVAPAAHLAGVSPQPLASGTRGTVRFTLPAATHIRLDLYDARGARVRVLADRRFPGGANEVTMWTRGADGSTLAPGVYFLRLVPVAGEAFAPLTARAVVLR